MIDVEYIARDVIRDVNASDDREQDIQRNWFGHDDLFIHYLYTSFCYRLIQGLYYTTSYYFVLVSIVALRIQIEPLAGLVNSRTSISIRQHHSQVEWRNRNHLTRHSDEHSSISSWVTGKCADIRLET